MSNEKAVSFENLFEQAIKDAGYTYDQLAGKTYDDIFYNITARMQKKLEEKDRQIKELREVLESYATMPDGEWMCKADNIIYVNLWADAKEALAKYSEKGELSKQIERFHEAEKRWDILEKVKGEI